MKRALFISYNGIKGIGAPQVIEGENRLAIVLPGVPMSEYLGIDPVLRKQKMIELFYCEEVLEQHDPSILVMYIGDHGLAEAFSLASMLAGEDKELHFVSCECQSKRKKELCGEWLLPNPHFHETTCGGEYVMRALLDQFIATGVITCFPRQG